MYLTESTVVQVTKDSIKGYCKSYDISGELKNQALWYRWAEVQSENVWGCSFPSTNPPCIALRCKLTRGASLVVTAVVQSLSHVQLFATPWTAARQASLSFTIS